MENATTINNETNTLLEPKPMSDFVETTYVKDITNRSLTYMKAGFPVHFRGPSGTGKQRRPCTWQVK